MNKGLSIVGAKRTKGEREKNDFYPTPPEATHALMQRENFEGMVWECACGNGAMSEVIKQYNQVQSSDLIDRGYGEVSNFLTDNRLVTNIITNPPYKYAKEFVLRAKKLANKKIAMLCKLVFLESVGRYEMFQDKEFPLSIVYVFCKRVSIYKINAIKYGSGLIAYAWFVWDKTYIGQPKIEWIL